MSDLFFLPAFPLGVERLPWYALVVLAAALAGEAVQRWLRLPRMLGWIAAGIVLGPNVLGLLDAASMPGLRPLLEVAVGVVLFELGQRVDPFWLRRNPWLFGTSVLESALAFLAMFAVLLVIDTPPLLAAVAAGIGIATAPAVVLSATRDLRAQGQVTERLLILTALNSIYAFIAVNVLVGWLARESAGDWPTVVLHPLYLVFGSLLLAVAFAASTLLVLRLLGRRKDAQFICVLALVVLAVGTAVALKLSVALSLLAYGALARIFDRRRLFVSLDFGRIGSILLILLFSISAAALDMSLLPAGALAGAALIAARYAGKSLGVFALARWSGLPFRKASLLSLGLMPISGVAAYQVQETALLFPAFGASLATVMISAIFMLELLGPLVAHFAIVRAGEADEELR